MTSNKERITWSFKERNPASGGLGVCLLSVLLVFFGSQANAITPNAMVWSYHSTNWNLKSIAVGNGMYVGVISEPNPQVVLTSPDGTNWTPRPLLGLFTWLELAFGNGVFVVVAGESDTALVSADGIAWRRALLPGKQDWEAITYGNGKFVAVAKQSGAVAVSTDGLNWIAGRIPMAGQWGSVTYGSGKFVAIANNGVAAVSTDGLAWSVSTLFPGVTNDPYCRSVSFVNGLFVVLTSGNKIPGGFDPRSTLYATSSDGVRWTTLNLPRSQTSRAIAFGDGLFVVVAEASDRVLVSSDCVTWSVVPLPSGATLKSIVYTSNKFIAVGEQVVCTSP